MYATNNLPLREHGSSLIFDIGARHHVSQCIHDLRVLQEADFTSIDITDDVAFLIWPDARISEVVEVLVETIECCSNKKDCSFHRLIFHGYDAHDESHLAVLQAACRHPLFQMLVVNSAMDGPSNEGTLRALKDAMLTNKGLKEIKIMHLEVSEVGFGILGDGLKETKTLENLSIESMLQARDDNIALPSTFLQGLKDNRSLKWLSLSRLPEQSWMDAILTALLGHPTLKDLRLDRSSWGDSSIAALGSLLSSPQCGISSLNLSYPSLDTRQVLTDNLADVLKDNQSIQWLGMSGFGWDDETFGRIWSELSSMKRLVSIDLGNNRIKSLKLPNSRKVAGLKQLDLSENPILSLRPDTTIKAEGSGILEFLQAHPQLWFLGNHFSKSNCCTPKLQHQLDMNANGRFLFGSSDLMTLSVWARVLERGNKKLKDDPIRQASVMYDLVRGISASL